MNEIKYLIVAYPADKPKKKENARSKYISEVDYVTLITDPDCMLYLDEKPCEVIRWKTEQHDNLKVIKVEYKIKTT